MLDSDGWEVGDDGETILVEYTVDAAGSSVGRAVPEPTAMRVD